MNFQELILALQRFWGSRECVLEQPFDVEVGAGTFHPATFFGVLGPKPWRVGYVQPSRRPADGRYGDNPMRMQFYYQYQVILKPSPDDVQALYLESLEACGVKLRNHDVRFERDDWKSPSQAAAGLGWQVVLDGLEISQFTYFQQMGGVELDPIPCELTYGTERIAMAVQNVESVWELAWTDQTSYGELRLPGERQFSKYNFEQTDSALARQLFDVHESEAVRLMNHNLYYPAYDQFAKCSHLFNLLDARGAMSTAERERMLKRVQTIARRCAALYLKELRSAESADEPAVVAKRPS